MTGQEARERVIASMVPTRICRTCGEPSRRIVESSGDYALADIQGGPKGPPDMRHADRLAAGGGRFGTAHNVTLGWTDCGHDDWRPGVWLDPFADKA